MLIARPLAFSTHCCVFACVYLRPLSRIGGGARLRGAGTGAFCGRGGCAFELKSKVDSSAHLQKVRANNVFGAIGVDSAGPESRLRRGRVGQRSGAFPLGFRAPLHRQCCALFCIITVDSIEACQ